MTEPVGYLNIVLHSHLPFVRHPEYPDFLEEDWFYEGMVETYAPLLMRLEKLRWERIPFRLTISVSSPLAGMMKDGLIRSRLLDYINKRLELLEKEISGNEGSHVQKMAVYYFNELTSVKDFIYNRHHGNVIHSLRSLEDSGHLEIITCTATHGLLPLAGGIPPRRAQILTAVRSHEKNFGKKPRGIWLAECGYEEGIDKLLAEAGIEYFFVDTHGLVFGDPAPVYGVYAPVVTEYGVSVFGRDPESTKQVWSQKEGYPGDFQYREFYRDLGHDANYEYIRPYLHSDGVKRNIGIKYHRITGDVELHEKQYYEVEKATETAASHAGNFLFNRQAQVRWLRDKTKYPPIIVAPYDAELYGHWWYEGPQFIEFLIRKTACDQNEVEMITASDYLDRHPIRQLQKPNPSTWGAEGHHLVWLNGSNCWMYEHQHWAEKKMEELANRFPSAGGDLKRALNQLLRELLLLQASDWAFIISTGTDVAYATKRFREHLDWFKKLAEQVEWNRIDLGFLSFLEDRNGIFPEAQYSDVLAGENDMEPVFSFSEFSA